MEFIKPDWLAKLRDSGVNITVSLARALNMNINQWADEPELHPDHAADLKGDSTHP